MTSSDRSLKENILLHNTQFLVVDSARIINKHNIKRLISLFYVDKMEEIHRFLRDDVIATIDNHK
jgi:hypothetical protein